MAKKIEEQFRVSRVGGFDKEDVKRQFQRARDEAVQERSGLQAEHDELAQELAGVDARLAALEEDLAKKEAEAVTLRSNIEGKYRSYIDNYDMIGKLANESREKAEGIRRQADEDKTRTLEEAVRDAQQVRSDADADAKRILEEANADAQKMREEAKKTVDAQRAEGQAKSEAAGEELTGVIEQFGRVQHQFMQTYKTIQEIIK